jgi:amino acid adenylation domain-containing protein
MPQSSVEEPILESNSFPSTTFSGSSVLRGPRVPEFLERTFVELFEEQVQRNPSHVAVIAGNRELTFAELNERANQVAYQLRRNGVGRESLVGICIDRSAEMAIGIVGILKAGGAYLPLDPEYPKERLAFLIQDAQPSVIVTNSNLTESIPESGARVVLLDDDALSALPLDEVVEQPRPADLAYVIYTSGSTGQPKGAMIEHRNLANYLLALNHELGIRSDDVYLHLASIAFSSSRRQLLLPLSQGATVVIASEAERKDPLALFETIKRRGVTVMDAVPSFWRSCTTILNELDEGERSELLENNLRLMLSASEPLPSDIPRTWMSEFKHPARHVHMFGQTETAGIVCINPITSEHGESQRIPIGRPIANTEILILDEQMNPCAAGEAGELYISGAGVGRCYLNRAELTAEKFITRNGARLYRTGDFARVREDGQLEFAGRRDQQIKLRGFRVELAEVEAALRAHPSIRECAVVAKTSEQATRLLAYFVSGADVSTGELREFLSERLPDYAIPSAFVFLEALPLSANGKVDRLALANRSDQLTDNLANYVAPRTLIEERLATIFAGLLCVERIGIDDNFFEAGGNSLLAGQAIARVRRAFTIQTPVTRLFESPTIRDFAAVVEAELRTAKPSDELPLVRVSRDEPLPLSFSQQRLWFLDQLDPGNYAYNLAHAMEISGALNVEALQRAFNAIVERHEILRTRFIDNDGTPFQKIESAAEVAWQFVDLSQGDASAKSRRLLETESRRAFDLAKGPLLRVLLMRIAPEKFILLMTMHHIVSDGWSTEVLATELSSLYEVFAQGKAPSLPALPVQYADFAAWQTQSATNNTLDHQLAYWQKQLADAPAVLNLATDYTRTAAQTYRGGKESLRLSRRMSDSLRHFGREHRATLFMVLLAAFDVMLALYTGDNDIVVGSPIAGRDRVEVEPLIGFFVNTLALRAALSPRATIREVIQNVRRTALEAYANQNVPFDMLVNQLQLERSLEHNPLFQVMFVLQNGKKSLPNLHGLTVNSIELNNDTSKFDLSLEAIDSDEVELAVSYSADLFKPESARAMLKDYERLLESFVANADAHVSELPQLTWKPQPLNEQSTAPAMNVTTTYVAPRTPIEEKLAAIWIEVLGIERVGIHDNFFNLGGHSLMATQVIARIRSTFDFELPLRRLFATPTIAGLADAICENQMARTEGDEFAALLAELEGLSDDEAQKQFAQEQAA